MNSRRARVCAATVLALALLGACSSSSEPKPLPESTSGADADQAEEREIIKAAESYQAALVAYQKGDRDIDLAEVATDEVVDGIVGGVKQSLDDEGLVMIGEYTLEASDVSVSDGTATYTGCLDNTRLLLVPEEDRDSPGVGSRPVGEVTEISYQLTQEGDSWLVSQPDGEQTPC